MDLTIIIGVAVVAIVILLVINHNRKSAKQESECCTDVPYKVEVLAEQAPIQQAVEPEVRPAIFADPVVEETVKKARKPRAAKAKTKKKTKKSKAV